MICGASSTDHRLSIIIEIKGLLYKNIDHRIRASQCAALKTTEIKSLQDFKLRIYIDIVATVVLTDAHIDLINTRRHAKSYGRYSRSEGISRERSGGIQNLTSKGHTLDIRLIFHRAPNIKNLFKDQVQC